MHIRYVIRFKSPVRVEDHWPISLMGGELRLVEDNNEVTAIELDFKGQPVSYAPRTRKCDQSSGVAMEITGRDDLAPFVQIHLRSALAFIQCYFNTGLLTEEITVQYFAETPDEADLIDIKELVIGKAKRTLTLPFDYITRSLMAAERSDGPSFEATLVSAARAALIEGKYIDSFRYSFLLIEAAYGNGKFKSDQLKETFGASSELVQMAQNALKARLHLKHKVPSDTKTLLASGTDAKGLLGHLVDKRGFYFHGNTKHKNAWKPQDQNGAEPLALIAIEIALAISHEAAAPMFADEFAQRHFLDAKRVGAIMAMKVDFEFREPDDTFDRNETMTINVPGTKVTPSLARIVAKEFLDRFEYGSPHGSLKAARCVVGEASHPVFEMTFYPSNESK